VPVVIVRLSLLYQTKRCRPLDHRKVKRCSYCKAPIAKLQSSSTVQHRFRSKQIFGDAKRFCPNFIKCAQKVVVQLLPTNFLPQRSWRPFFGMTSKQRFSFVFLQTLGDSYWSQTKSGAIFVQIFRDFPQIVRDLFGFSGISLKL